MQTKLGGMRVLGQRDSGEDLRLCKRLAANGLPVVDREQLVQVGASQVREGEAAGAVVTGGVRASSRLARQRREDRGASQRDESEPGSGTDVTARTSASARSCCPTIPIASAARTGASTAVLLSALVTQPPMLLIAP